MFREGAGKTLKSFPVKRIRRDTHDDTVPEEVFRLLELSIRRCPNLKYVVLEQLSNGLDTEQKRKLFRQDFTKLDTIIKKENDDQRLSEENTFLPPITSDPGEPVKDALLYAQQTTLSNILETATSYRHAVQLLQLSILANTDWKTENWEPYMLETAIAIAQKWKNGFA